LELETVSALFFLFQKLNPFPYVIVGERGVTVMKQSKIMTKVIAAGSLIVICSLVAMASGCSTESDEAAAIKVGENLKMMQYQITVDDIETDIEERLKKQDEYKPFLTEKGYTAFAMNRQSAIATGYALKNKLNMKVTKLELENMHQDNMEEDTFSFRYSIDIELSPSEMTDSRGKGEVTKTGHMTVVKENGEWKVLKDLDNGFLGEATSQNSSYLKMLPNERIKQYELFVSDKDSGHLQSFSPEEILLIYIHASDMGDVEVIYALAYDNGVLPDLITFRNEYNKYLSKSAQDMVLKFRYYDSIKVNEDTVKLNEVGVEISISTESSRETTLYGLKKEGDIWKIDIYQQIEYFKDKANK
jgi:hypothetical protein